MSASPAQHVSGSSSVTPTTGGPTAPIIRKKAPTCIFNTKKSARKPLPAHRQVAGGPIPTRGTQASEFHGQPRSTVNGVRPGPAPVPKEPKFQEYPILVHKGDLLRGIHHHALKLQTSAHAERREAIIANPYDESQFTRPVRLYRRSARDKFEQGDQSDAGSGVDDKTREFNEIKRAEREAQKEANQALIAPTGETAKRPNKKKPQKKVEDVYYDESNPKHQARSRLRYEEARPWHLEDFGGKNKWVGSYEEPLSMTNVMFAIEEGGFRMVPIEKWYRFIRTDRVTALPTEQIEKLMNKPMKVPRWFSKPKDAAEAATQEVYRLKKERQEQARRPTKREDSDEEASGFVKNEDYRADVDEIDFEYNDEFQDDDEGLILGAENDDETKEIEKKIREEMRGANLAGTGVKDEDKDWDEEEQEEKRAEAEERKKQKKIRKQLKKKELRHEYESDSDRAYESSSDSEDTDEERERHEEERKKEEARKDDEKSGASTRGTNTPSGRPEKKVALSGSLKREADLSELSGNESSRKKAKLNGVQTDGSRQLSRTYFFFNCTSELTLTIFSRRSNHQAHPFRLRLRQRYRYIPLRPHEAQPQEQPTGLSQ